MAEWQPIDTAPKDMVVLTDWGTGIYKMRYRAYQWYLCDWDGDIPSCNEYGAEIAEIEPTHWQPLPSKS